MLPPDKETDKRPNKNIQNNFSRNLLISFFPFNIYSKKAVALCTTAFNNPNYDYDI